MTIITIFVKCGTFSSPSKTFVIYFRGTVPDFTHQ
jgi:hypothetical protein